MKIKLFGILIAVAILCSPAFSFRIKTDGEMKRWHKMTVTFNGLDLDESAELNPFLDYRLNVTFIKGDKRYVVPGFYSADGNAGQSGATGGNKWQVHFTPDSAGWWGYTVSFRKGSDIAISEDPDAGMAVGFDGLANTFEIHESDKSGRDFRGKGMLRYSGERYLQFAESGEYFIKAGADSPENFLAYFEFDGTYDTAKLDRKGEAVGDKFIHQYKPHAKDYRKGDPTWRKGKGKNIIGALNYLASQGMNSIYFLTYNLDGGDGQDVWPWTDPNERFRFDCSKLDQWEIVFSHAEQLGIMLHVVTQETENDQGLDGGELGRKRKLYYRELIARFGHHLGLVWNLGEENSNTTEQLKAFTSYFKKTDPYKHPVVVHNGWDGHEKLYGPLVGYGDFDGASLQMNKTGSKTHSETLKWLERSAKGGWQWFVCLDEFGGGGDGVYSDSVSPDHDIARKNCLWGNLMAGGGGFEWYFSYKSPINDLNCEDWRSREKMWEQSLYALDFFHKYLPFWQMKSADSLVSNGWCFAKEGAIYAVYLPKGGSCELQLTDGKFGVQWYNPRKGGNLATGSVVQVTGPGKVLLGKPGKDKGKDWVILVKKKK
ncbi:MAG: DUF5060 domain-containing protein [Planctomycetes bacterium]|nr:DUF5060 domain-containing protein [Planctomycetota bacterium]